MTEPWSKFFWSDWEADHGLRLCSLAAQGLWMRMLCVCARHDPKGYLAINGHPLTVTDIARLAGVAETEAEILMEELGRNGVFSRNRTGVIYSRRMVKDEKRSKEGRKWKNLGLSQATENKGEKSAPARGATSGPSPHILEARSLEEKEICAAEASPSGKAAKSDLAEAWERFRRAYPRRDGSQDWPKAREIFDRAVKAGVDPKAIIGGAERYAADCRRRGDEGGKFVKQARSWLNGRLWEEYAGASAGGSSSAWAPAGIDWRGLVRNFRSSGNWPSSIGPGPDQSGCRAPPEILAEFGLTAGGETRGNA
ncbi:hypothetical protein V5F79_08350 [Xanthobacter flavus]|uniref:hypothetical protein n=1 Tax=Xanthobacter flavus TaxID=281 RepID=UPI003726B8FD